MTEDKAVSRSGNHGCLWIIVLLSCMYGALQLWRAYARYDIGIKYDHAMKQCEKYGGQIGNIPIIANGVYDRHSGTFPRHLFYRAAIFLNNGLEYAEFEGDLFHMDSNLFDSYGPHFKGHRTKRFLYYRAYIATRGDKLCVPYEALLKSGYSRFETDVVSADECVAVLGFDDPALLKASYELVLTNKVINEGVKISWDYLEITDRQSNSVLASYNTFSQCFTKMVKHREGFFYCSGIYNNSEANATCPEDYRVGMEAAASFEEAAFDFKGGKL